MTKNLLSVSKLAKDNDCVITFSTDNFVVKNKQGEILAKGHKKGGLYALDLRQPQQIDGLHAYLASTGTNKAPYSIWLRRMRHLNESYIRVLSNNNAIDVSSWKALENVCTE